MADFNVDLAAPRAQGSQPVSPVQEQVVQAQPNQLLSGIVNIFAKGLEIDSKQAHEARKQAVIKEYLSNEDVYTTAFTSGQWNAAQAASASRINFQKMYAGYGDMYGKELHEARTNYQGGSALSDAQKEVDAANALFEHQKTKAVDMGFMIVPGASKEVEQKTVEAAQAEERANRLDEQANKREAEQRARKAEGRAEDDHVYKMQTRLEEDNAQKGVLEAVDKHFDLTNVAIKDILNSTSMTPESKQLAISQNLAITKAKLTAISGKYSQLAAPWVTIFDQIAATATKLADPTAKSERDMTLAKNEFDTLMYKAKTAMILKPETRNAVAVSNLFGNNQAMIGLALEAPIVGILAEMGLGPNAKNKISPVVDTSSEKEVLKGLSHALNNLENNKVPGDQTKAKQEAVYAVDEILKQTGGLDNGIEGTKLKDLATFYSSPEFGKLAERGVLNRDSIVNASKVFDISFTPNVTKAISDRLELKIERSPGRDQGNRGKPVQTLLDTVDIKFNGMGVSLVTKPSSFDTLSSSMERTALKDAESGLNQLIRIGAHMEGTTNYAEYWDRSKHLFLPKVYPDPEKLKVGQVIQGKNGKSYKYLGGNFNDIANSYMEVKVGNGE